MARLRPWSPPATLGFVVAIALVSLVASGLPTSSLSGRSTGSAPPAVGSGPVNGASELGWAASSLARPSIAHGPPVGEWANITTSSGAPPSARVSSMVWDGSDGYVLLYGGFACNTACVLGDTWTFSDGNWTNITSKVTGAPPPVVLAGLAVDPTTGEVVLFGGARTASGSNLSSATWTYHAGIWTNISSTVGATPPALAAPAMATDSADGEIVMTGGQNASSVSSGWTWTFKGGTWTNESSIAGSSGGLILPTAADDPAAHGVLLFGIQGGNTGRSATLIYSGGTWHNYTSTLAVEPPAMYLGTAGYLPGVAAVVAFAGVLVNHTGGTGIHCLVTWAFYDGAWYNQTDLTGVQPATFLAVAGAVDPNTDSWYLFGGETLTVPLSPWTYVLSGPPSVTASASRSVTDAGMSVALTASVRDGLAPNSVSWNFGDGSANGVGAVASHTFARAGLFLATATATSAVGQTGTADVAVFVNPPLSANATVVGTPTAGSATAFALAVSGGTAPFTYAWTFGDGATGTSLDPTHTYGSTRTYTASVKVTDSVGASVNETVTVPVAAAPSTSASLTSGLGLGLLVGIIVLVVVVIALAVLLMTRRPKGPMMMAPAPPPPPPTPAPGAGPAGPPPPP
jgi:hypothetical protein